MLKRGASTGKAVARCRLRASFPPFGLELNIGWEANWIVEDSARYSDSPPYGFHPILLAARRDLD